MGQLYNEDWEHVDIEAFREAIIGNGVISGLEVTQSATPAMTVAVSAGQCTIDGVVYADASAQNLNISNGGATHDRKDIVVYDATAGNPAVVAGTPAAAPVPPDIPSGDILLGIVLVEANEVTSILNADITEDRVYSIVRWANTSVSVNTTLNDAHYVVSVDATGGARTITLPTAVGIRGKVYVVKKIDSSNNTVTIDPNGSQTIDGDLTAPLPAQWSSMIIQSDGANWIRLATDKTDNQIRDAVEAATDSNTFNDADHTKLNGIESGATQDQTDSQIRDAVEAATDSNTFNDADHTKLNSVDTNADVTGSNTPQNHASRHETNGADVIDGVAATVVASSTSIFSNDAVRTCNNYTPEQEVKAIIGTMFSGTIRVSWQQHGTSGQQSYSRLYIDGVDVTGRQDTSSTSYVTFSFDVGIKPGDRIELRGATGNSSYLAYFRYLRISGTTSALTIQSNDP